MILAFVGESAALATAACFAICTLAFAFAGRRVDAQTINLVRIVSACVVLTLIHVAVYGRWWPDAPGAQLRLLAFSGFVGLAFGDICLFACLVRVGPRLGSLLMALAPVMTAILAHAIYGEVLGLTQWIAVGVVTFGVLIVVGTSGRDEWRAAPGLRFGPGIVFGVLAAFGQAYGLVLSKAGMGAFEGAGAADAAGRSAIDPFSATVVRMGVGALATILFVIFARLRIRPSAVWREPFVRNWTAVGIVTGPILGVWLSMVAVRASDAGIAATLMATTPIMMIPISRIAYGAHPSRLAVAGTVVAVVGAVLLEIG